MLVIGLRVVRNAVVVLIVASRALRCILGISVLSADEGRIVCQMFGMARAPLAIGAWIKS